MNPIFSASFTVFVEGILCWINCIVIIVDLLGTSIISVYIAYSTYCNRLNFLSMDLCIRSNNTKKGRARKEFISLLCSLYYYYYYYYKWKDWSMLSRKRCRGTLQDYNKGEISKCQSELWTNRNVFSWCLKGTREETVRSMGPWRQFSESVANCEISFFTFFFTFSCWKFRI